MAEPSITFVVCVEAGWLEQQAVRLAQSLRRFGGNFRGAPVLAVKARFGPPLARTSIEAFNQLSVRYLQERPDHRYTWQNFMNKPAALLAAEKYATTDTVCWLDSDILVVDDPVELALLPGEDFAACSTSKDLASEGPDDPHEPFWIELGRLFDLRLDDLPWVTTLRDKKRVRLHFNSGVFVYRRSTGFARAYHDDNFRILDARIAHRGAHVQYTDQVVLGLTMHRLGMKWRMLGRDHNYTIGEFMKKTWYRPEQVRAAKLLHYHRIMEPTHFPTLLELMKEHRPVVYEWLSGLGPINVESLPPAWRAIQRALHYYRIGRRKLHVARCRKF